MRLYESKGISKTKRLGQPEEENIVSQGSKIEDSLRDKTPKIKGMGTMKSLAKTAKRAFSKTS
mgnify:FL=1